MDATIEKIGVRVDRRKNRSHEPTIAPSATKEVSRNPKQILLPEWLEVDMRAERVKFLRDLLVLVSRLTLITSATSEPYVAYLLLPRETQDGPNLRWPPASVPALTINDSVPVSLGVAIIRGDLLQTPPSRDGLERQLSRPRARAPCASAHSA